MARTGPPWRRENPDATVHGRLLRRIRDGPEPRRRRTSRGQRDWSNLPNLALFSILQRLTIFRDLFAFGGVCRAWRAVSRPALPDLLSSHPPLVCGNGGQHLYSFPDGRFYRSTLPGLSRRNATVLGFSCGYLIMADARYPRDLWLVNPFTGDEVVSVPRFHRARMVRLAALTAPPSSPGCVLMAWCRLAILYWRPGELSWSTYWYETAEQKRLYRWPIVMEGAVYALTDEGNLLRFEFVPHLRVIRVPARGLHLRRMENVWLVTSGGEILAIIDYLYLRKPYKVYRLDCSGGEWVRLKTLGDRALLLSTPSFGCRDMLLGTPGPALCDDRPNKWGGEANRIYFSLFCRLGVKVIRLDGCQSWTVSANVSIPSYHWDANCCCSDMFCCSSRFWVLPSLCC